MVFFLIGPCGLHSTVRFRSIALHRITGCGTGRPVGVVFRGHHEGPLLKPARWGRESEPKGASGTGNKKDLNTISGLSSWPVSSNFRVGMQRKVRRGQGSGSLAVRTGAECKRGNCRSQAVRVASVCGNSAHSGNYGAGPKKAEIPQSDALCPSISWEKRKVIHREGVGQPLSIPPPYDARRKWVPCGTRRSGYVYGKQ
jgi:hypothetical protein